MNPDLPPRNQKGHKGIFGTVAVAAGSITDTKVMIGGAAFAAKSALRSGAGMVVFINKKDVLIRLIEMVPQAIGMTELDPEETSKWKSIILGPALGYNRGNVELISKLLSLKLPTVIDADGLNTIATHPHLIDYIHEHCVLTPHPGEFERLSKTLSVKTSEDLANRLNCIVALKDSKTSVTDGERNYHIDIPNPALATGGTGDFLAGLIGGLMAQYCPDQLTVFDCACLGVKIQSKAGVEWKNRQGSAGLFIDELLELVPEVMEKMREAKP